MAEDPKLPSKLTRQDERALQNSGSGSGRILDLAMANLSESEKRALVAKAMDARLDLEVDSQRRDNKYYEARRSTDDHIEAFRILDKSGKLTTHKIVSDLETGAGSMRIESKSGATCFVASAAYDDPNHPDVMFLRDFRDTKLKTTRMGRAFIATYWMIGPVLAKPVARYPALRRVARKGIERIVQGLRRAWTA